jgi:predicted nucleotidyltransferase
MKQHLARDPAVVSRLLTRVADGALEKRSLWRSLKRELGDLEANCVPWYEVRKQNDKSLLSFRRHRIYSEAVVGLVTKLENACRFGCYDGTILAMDDRRELANLLQQTLGNFPTVKLAYLFGSQAQGNTGPLSDYDVGVLFDGGQDAVSQRARLTHELTAVLGTDRVDVVPLNDAPIELAYAVIAQGYLIYQRDVATRVEYEAQVMSRYGDYLPVLRAQRSSLLNEENYDARVQRYRAALGRTERTLGQITSAAKQNAR